MADSIQVNVDFTDLQLLRRELLGVSKDAKSSASVFESAYRKVESQLNKSAKVSQQYYSSVLGLDKSMKSASSSATVFEKSFAKAAVAEKQLITANQANSAELKRLRMSVDSVYAAEQKLLNLKKLLRTEVAAGNMTMREAAAVQAKYKTSLLQSNVAQMAATKSSNRLGVVTQQAGYQVGDFLVQVQSGASPFVAFGQQATQLVGILPLLADKLGMSTMKLIGISSALGIAIPLITAIGYAFSKSELAAKLFTDKTAGLTAAIKALNEEAKTAAENTAFIFSGEDTLAIYKAKVALDSYTLSLVNATKGKLGAKSTEEDVLNFAGSAEEAAYYLGMVKNVTDAEAALTTARAVQSGSKRLSEQMEREKAIAESIAKDTMDFLGKQSEANAEAVAAAIAKREETDAWIESQKEAYKYSSMTIDLEGEALLIAQQRIDKINLFAELHERDLEATKGEGLVLVQNLSKLQDIELAIFRNAEAKKVDKTAQDNLNKSLAEQDKIQKALEQNAKIYGDAMSSGLMSIVDGTKSVKEAFRSMALDIIKHLYKVLVVESMVRSIGGALANSSSAAVAKIGTGLTTYGQADGGAWQNGVQKFANGGVVGSPTYFGMGGGQTGLMGEAGPEAIMPLKRGPDGKLGVSTTGGSQSITVVQNINVSTGVQQTVRAEVMGLMPQIAAASKAAVLDAKRRGGSFGGSFR
jgi:hypothetical protein